MPKKQVPESREAKANWEKVEAFASAFVPPLPVVRTQQIGGEPVRNGFAASAWSDERKVGVTAVAWGAGNFKAYIETVPGKKDKAAPQTIGSKFAVFLRNF